ncbi:hypothetical protein [Acinetobacter sp. YH1901134]|uniref:hypothetical protein n=1 Tax=Acinetobacter sp. YH1901134 TaxID=2601199 RepID=UPI0015D315E7|nr:hypothetical protein [Acinetobacter sp. YH1901134]
MDKYYVIDNKIQLSKQGGGALSKVKYKVQIVQNNKVVKEIQDVTDENGQTKNVIVESICQLRFFVYGFKSPYSAKSEWMIPLFSKSDVSNIIVIDEEKLLENSKFPSEQKYELRKKELKNTIKVMKENSTKRILLNNGIGKINLQKSVFELSGSKPIDPKFAEILKNKSLSNSNGLIEPFERSLNDLGNSYIEYKKKCTQKIYKAKIFFLKTYSVFQFMNSQLKPISNIQYQVFEKNNNKPILNNFPKSAEKNGVTGIAFTTKSSQVKYKIGNQVKESEFFPPITCIDKNQINQIRIGVAMGGSSPNENTTVGLGKAKKIPIVVNPHTDELLILPPDAFDTFEKITRDLEDSIKNIHRTKYELDEKMNYLSSSTAKSTAEIEEIEKRLNINQQKAIEKLNEKFGNKADLREVLVLETKGDTKTGEKQLLRKYLTAKEYDQLKSKRLNFEAKVKIKAAAVKSRNYEEDGDIEIDLVDMKKSFDDLKEQLSVEIYKKKFGDDEKVIYDMIGGIGGEIAEQYKNSKGVNVSVESQWMRLVAGNGGEASIHATNKGTSIRAKGDLSAKFVLFEKQKEWRSFYPSENGWNLEVGDMALGTIRFIRGCSLHGFAGANIGLAGNLSVDLPMTVGAPQVVYPTTRTPRRTNATSRGILEPTDTDFDKTTENQVTAEVKAFGGAQIGVTVLGSLEWYNDKTESPAKFVNLASAAPTVGGSIGGGFEGKFQIFLEGGKFKFRVALHVCWGIGAKGALDFEVDFKQMWHFALFVKSQLLQASFKQLLYINELAFTALAQILAYCIGDNHPLTQNVNELVIDFSVWISGLSSDQQRYRAAMNINSPSGLDGLVIASPETKGILIYGVTHWTTRTASLFDMTISMSGLDVEINRFVTRKNAIINIFKTCISTQEWMNVIQHVHPRAKTQSKSNMQKIEGDIIRFLNYGEDASIAEDIIIALNSGGDYAGGRENQWLKDFLKYRKQAKPIQGYPLNHLIVKNQDDMQFKQLDYMGGYADNTAILASNLDILAPFEDQEIQLYQT